jgi:hypothetical protein
MAPAALSCGWSEGAMASRVQDLYRDYFYAWTRDQAGALRRLAETRPNADVDWANLLEEVEDLGKADLRAVQSQLRRVIEHCLKLSSPPPRTPGAAGSTRSTTHARRSPTA